jgi:transcriptional regulator with XRE-family HTH domain
MLAKTLQSLIDQHLTNAAEIAELTGVAPSTVYRWLKGQSEPSFNSVRLLLRHVPNTSAQHAILSAFIAGSEWQVMQLRAELDLNRDGRIDHDDALDACIESVRSASKALSQVRINAAESPDKRAAAEELIHLLADVIRHCSTAQQILVHVNERRKAAQIRKSGDQEIRK